jgi:TetR/AcrR family transcriptional regulator
MAARKPATATVPTRDAVFDAASAMFSARGFDGVSMDDIAKSAGVNKAMIYYHHADKLALYRAVIGSGLQAMGETIAQIVQTPMGAPEKLDRFIEAFVRMTEVRPWMPTMMLREMAEGAPHLDADTLAHMRGLVEGFGAILVQGQRAGQFRDVNPLLAYFSIVAPIIFNTARERVAQQPGRDPQELPLLATISHADVIAHGQKSARRMLLKRKLL